MKDPASDHCAIVDSVMDIDYAAGRITYDHADALIAEIQKRGLTLDWIIETHVHADHLSAAPYIQQKLGGKIGVGDKIMVVQDTFGKIFNEGTEFQRDGSQFDALFKDGDTYKVGEMEVFTIYTPGHTPACMVHVMGDAAFVGDTLFMPDGGSARADFPGGDAGTLYDSIQKVLELPDEMRLFMCHDYGPNGREIQLGDHCGRGKGQQHPCRRRQDARGLHQVPHGTRCDPRHAEAHYSVVAGEHACRRGADRPRWKPDAEGARQQALSHT